MKILLKKAVALTVTVLMILCLALPCFAATQKGSVTVTLEDKQKNKINGVTVNICQIAILDSTGYYPAKPFENSGISISGIITTPNLATAKSVAEFVDNNNVTGQSLVSENGKVTFSDLDIGIWLVYPNKENKYKFNPFIVFVPFKSEDSLCYDVTSAPKLEDTNPDEITIYVVKKWDDKNNAAKKRPEFVTLELLNGNAVVSSVKLSESNAWAHTFTGLKKDGDYSVREKSVADYKPTYSGDKENGFIVTNTYVGEKLPQTGQYWWPIVLLAVIGGCLVVLGIYELGVKKNAQKN